jgi:DNA-directed RNA polymerase subunit RPC12/RpoP
MSPYPLSRERQFEECLRDGITAAKNGDRKIAQRWLERALMLNARDARPYIWLSATTDDITKQRQYLEQAVAVEPGNATARRGLAILSGKINQNRLLKEGHAGTAENRESQLRETVISNAYNCPQCGGRMIFKVTSSNLTCEYCGFEEHDAFKDSLGTPSAYGDQTEQMLDYVIPTTLGHNWAQDQYRVICEHCGAINLLAPGEKVTKCAYCGSNQMIDITEQDELIDPHIIIVMQIKSEEAVMKVKSWLGSGFFTPDNLLSASKGLRLRPAYYSAWIFGGTLEIKWTCEVKEGNGTYQDWKPMSGVETRFFDDILVPGFCSITEEEFSTIEPYDLAEADAFKPEYLVGWPTVIYDRSVSDASLIARGKVMQKIRPQLYSSIEVGRELRNLRFGAGSWSSMTFKHALVPVWMGTYHYQGEEYNVLVNGQTGKVGGNKPRDNVKVTFAGLAAVVFVLLVVVLYLILRGLLETP